MILSVAAIVLSIITFFEPWFFIGVIIAIVLAVGEYILELTHGEMFSSAAIVASVIVVGLAALILSIIAIVSGLKDINAVTSSGESGNLLSAIRQLKLFI